MTRSFTLRHCGPRPLHLPLLYILLLIAESTAMKLMPAFAEYR